MKRLLPLLVLIMTALPVGAQSVFGVAQSWRSKSYVAESVDAKGVLKAFSDNFKDNSLVRQMGVAMEQGAQKGTIFAYEPEVDYIMLRIMGRHREEMQVKVWKHPKGVVRAAVKLVNEDEDTIPRLFLFAVAADGKMTPMDEPEGIVYDDIVNFFLPCSNDDAIDIEKEHTYNDHILPRSDGSFEYMPYVASPAASLTCYILDKDPLTNVRRSPGGELLGQLRGDDDYMLTICEPSKGWWKIFGTRVGSLDISGGAWIHYSVLGMRTRNYGGQALTLRAAPSADAQVVATIRTEEMTVRPVDISADGEWTKIKCAAGTGWIESSWLCGNPYTTCA